MQSRFWIAVAVVLVVGCAGPKLLEKPAQVERQALRNPAYFDVATCGGRPLTLIPPVNSAALTGYLVSTEPWVTECLIDSHRRGPAATTRVELKVTVTEKSARFEVSGANLVPAGISCIQEALERLGSVPALPAGSPPVHARTEIIHERDKSPTLIYGVNEVSDFAADVRLAFPLWCDCFTPWKEHAPRALATDVDVKRRGPKPVTAEFELTNSSNSDEVASCLKRKIEALDVSAVKAKELRLSLPLYFVHSGVAESLLGSPPNIQFLQLEAVRRRRAADVAVRMGARTETATHYDDLVKRFKVSRKSVKMPALKEACADLVKSDDVWLSAISHQMEMEDEAVSLASELKTKDASWAEAEKTARAEVARSQAEREKVKKLRSEDESACPKERF